MFDCQIRFCNLHCHQPQIQAVQGHYYSLQILRKRNPVSNNYLNRTLQPSWRESRIFEYHKSSSFYSALNTGKMIIQFNEISTAQNPLNAKSSSQYKFPQKHATRSKRTFLLLSSLFLELLSGNHILMGQLTFQEIRNTYNLILMLRQGFQLEMPPKKSHSLSRNWRIEKKFMQTNWNKESPASLSIFSSLCIWIGSR